MFVRCFNSFVLDYVHSLSRWHTLNMFYMYQLPVPRLTPGNPYFDAIVPRAARLTCTRPEFADLWRRSWAQPWDRIAGAPPIPPSASGSATRSTPSSRTCTASARADFDHILGTFPLVFPDDAEGHQKKERLLSVYDAFAQQVAGWR